MTPAKSDTTVVVVDGSNIATEGRSMPSLAQLNEAVMAFTDEYPDATITVVVDATFGHRIDKKESSEFDAAVAHNELVAPPAGAIGRGDAFVLSIANKVGARILSNDSFQEFHGDYPWLFDEGRLIGGKPVPFVGWVFVDRLPVKGPVSRKATRGSRNGREREPRPSRRTSSRAASQPMPVPTSPPPRARHDDTSRAGRDAVIDEIAETAPVRAPTPSGAPVNDLLPFLDFVEHHPVGSSVNGVVESYSSHGAYVTIGDVRGYIPLRLMGEPPPRSAREVMKLGDAVTLVVTSFAPARRSVDLSIPKVAPVGEVVATPVLDELAEAVSSPPARTPRSRSRKSAAPAPDAAVAVEKAAAATPSAARKAGAKKAAGEAAPAKEAVAEKVAAAKVAAKNAAPKNVAAKKAPAKAAVSKKAPTKKAPTKKAVAKTAVAKKVPAKKVSAKKVPAKKVSAKKVSAKKVSAKKVSATTTSTKAAGAKKAPARKAPAKKAVVEPAVTRSQLEDP